MPVLYTRNKPHKKKPNWKNILLTAFCLVLVVCSVTLLVKAVPSWNSGTQLNKSSASPAPSQAAETPVPSESPSPTETPAPSESVEPSAEPTPARGSGVQSITFGAVGSIMMHAHELQAAKTGNSYDFGSFFARVQPYLSWQDVTLGTLETTIASDKFDETRAPAQLLTAMKNNGFDLVSLASAQILDSDIAGAQATVQAAKDAELLSTGAYASGSDYVKPLIIEKDDLRIAVLSYTEKTDKLPDGATDTVKYLTEATFDNDLKQIRADETGIDFIIVCVQWSGDSAELTDSQKAWAQIFADNDVDVVLGTCAHRQQSLTYVQGRDGNRTLVAYKGLGGDVVIPDDEGILYIGSFAFCLYTTDRNVELTEDDYDANKIPESNKTITSVTIPEGVQEVRVLQLREAGERNASRIAEVYQRICVLRRQEAGRGRS